MFTPLHSKCAVYFDDDDSSSKATTRAILQGLKTFSPGVKGTSTFKTDNKLLYERAPNGSLKAVKFGPGVDAAYASSLAGKGERRRLVARALHASLLTFPLRYSCHFFGLQDVP